MCCQLLQLFSYLASKEEREKKAAAAVDDDDRPLLPWNCPACTFYNAEPRAKCQVCGTAAPKEQVCVCVLSILDRS